MVAPPIWPFELSPLNELYNRGKLVSSTLIPFTYISVQNGVSHARMVTPLELSPLNELNRRKLVRSITLILF